MEDSTCCLFLLLYRQNLKSFYGTRQSPTTYKGYIKNGFNRFVIETDKGSTTCLYFGLTAASLLSGPGKRFAVALVDVHESVAPRVAVPVKRRLDRCARHPGQIEESQGASYDRSLHLGIPGFPTGISQRKIGEDEAGDAALLYNVPRAADDHSGNAIRL
jgi:hypothetical protein